MTRSDLIASLAVRFPQFTHTDAKESVSAILESISAQLVDGGRVEVRGFGVFSIHIRSPQRGRNPMTGAKVDVPAKAVPHFKPGSEMRARVNQKI